MTLDDIPDGTSVYVDANIFIYNFTAQSDECRRLLNRCYDMDLIGVTGTHVLLEVAHRLMMIEAVAKGLVSAGNVPAKLKSRPEVVSQLTDYSTWISEVANGNVTALDTDMTAVSASLYWRRRYGLLVNDSVSAALMNRFGINAIATNDRDFQRIQGLAVHMPGDL